jgi:HEAT repeat protein
MYNTRMDWFSGSRQGEARRLLSQLGDTSKRERATQELIRMGAEAVPALVDALQSKDEGLLPLYQQILARIPSATALLVKALREAHPLTRLRAAEVFALSKDKAAIPALLEALKGEYFTVRARAAEVLGTIGEPEVLPELLMAIKDPEAEVRMAGCAALGRFRDPSSIDELADILLNDPVIEVRQAAARTLGDLQHPAALPFLMEALRDPFWWYEREQAAGDLLDAIEKLGAETVEALIEALEDREGTVRKFAASMLGRIGDPRAIEPLGMAQYDLHYEVGKAAAEALAGIGAGAVEILIQALSHPEAEIREHAVLALGRIQDPRSGPVLLEMLRDPDRSVRKQAIQSLGLLRDQRAIPALQKIASSRTDREFSALAKQALELFR